MLNILLFENEDPPNQDPFQESDCKWDWLGALWPCPESWSPHTGQCAGWRVPHTGSAHVGARDTGQTRDRGTCETSGWWSCSCGCRPISSPKRGRWDPRVHGHPGGYWCLVSLCDHRSLYVSQVVMWSTYFQLGGKGTMWLPGQVWMGVWFYLGGAVSRGFIFLSRSW